MGMFLSLSSVIGKTQNEVCASLTNYAKSVNGGLQQENLTTDNDNCCVIEEGNNNVTVFYPNGYLEWDNSSKFISKELKTSVFSFHIHDGDLWMYVLYSDGEIVDQFNPIPDYWDNDISDEEIESWKGNAFEIAKYIPGLNSKEIENYITRWDLDSEENNKAYPDDEFTNEDWQLLDFMKKLKLPYPLDDNFQPKGQVYKLWTKELPLRPISNSTTSSKTREANINKPWWKLW
ncbi:MAG: hypothetical protein WBP43_05985 [Chitinophagales bacterium]|nr:hypothetical protein [Bacteroidota bacterium]